MKTRVYGALVAPLLLLLIGTVAACANEPRVVIPAPAGDVSVTVEIAATPAKRNFGLMYRKDLGPDAGMLFVFDETSEHSFWMKNTPLPLDMIFLDEDRRIVGIVRDATPFTTTSRTVGKPSRYVLEVHGGFSAKHGLADGAQARFEGFPPSVATP